MGRKTYPAQLGKWIKSQQSETSRRLNLLEIKNDLLIRTNVIMLFISDKRHEKNRMYNI